MNGELIPGANSNGWVAQESGACSVVVVTFGDRAGICTEVLVSTVGVPDAHGTPGLFIRMDAGSLEVQVLQDELVTLRDVTGRLVAQGRASGGVWRHALQPAANGVYLLNVDGRCIRLPVLMP